LRIFIEISYKGSSFNGWQRQKNTSNTIQEHIEKVLSQVFRKDITVVGCGRTDKQVHARQYYLHFDIENCEVDNLKYKLNRILSKDIVVKNIMELDQDYHARFSAKSRTYHYFFHRHKNAFLEDLSSHVEGNLNFDLMKKALALLEDYDDYRAFCKSPDKHPSTICKILEPVRIDFLSDDRFVIKIKANRFLRSMMRILAQRIIDLGRGKIIFEEFENFLKEKKPELNYKMMTPHGLYLEKVEYIFINPS